MMRVPLSMGRNMAPANFTWLRTLLLACAASVLLAGCNGTKLDETETLPVEQLYGEAHSSMKAGNYERSSRYFKRLVARFPFGRYTEQAELELAFTQYRSRDPEEALSTINRFIRTYPTHPHIAYAYYLRALINFDRQGGFLERYIRQDSSRRDLANAKQSFQDFSELVQRYPGSAYARDARQRMIHLRNGLAQAELNTALFYFRRKAYVAAQNRAKYLLESYPQSPQGGDALAIMAESYARLGEAQLAEDTRKVLRLNYPQHPYLSGGWPARRSLWKQLIPFMGEQA